MTPKNLALLLMLVGTLLFFLGFAAGAAGMAFELHRKGYLHLKSA